MAGSGHISKSRPQKYDIALSERYGAVCVCIAESITHSGAGASSAASSLRRTSAVKSRLTASRSQETITGCIAAFALKSQNVCRETAADLFGYSLIILPRKSYGKAGRYVHTDSTGKEPVGV